MTQAGQQQLLVRCPCGFDEVADLTVSTWPWHWLSLSTLLLEDSPGPWLPQEGGLDAMQP